MTIATSVPFRRAVLTQLRPILLTCWARLFVNDITPDVSSVASDFAQPAGSWYQPIRLTQWGQPYKTPDNSCAIVEVTRTWTAAGTLVSEAVYGYYVTDQNGLFVWGERGPAAPYPMGTAGQLVRFLPRLFSGELC